MSTLLVYLLVGYLIGALLTAARLGWHMAFRLDEFSWHYDDIWIAFAVCVLFWPLLLTLGIRDFISPDPLFEKEFGFAKPMREKHRLWNNPPPCGSRILYRQRYGRHGTSFGDIILPSSVVEDAIAESVREVRFDDYRHDSAILKWLRQRDDSITEPTALPDAWDQFRFIASKLLIGGHGEIYCEKCMKPVSVECLQHKVDAVAVRPGWSYSWLRCTHGHPILVAETVHVLLATTE